MTWERALIGLSFVAAVSAAGVVAIPAAPPETRPEQAVAAEQHHVEVGDEMNKIARRMAAVWFAGQAENRELALYELHEIGEVIEKISDANPVENGVHLAGVLEAIEGTQLAALKTAIESGDRSEFELRYRDTVHACNECHRIVDHAFIRIDIPTAPPVSNRRWNYTTKDADAAILRAAAR